MAVNIYHHPIELIHFLKTCGDIYKRRATLSVLDKQFHLHSLLLISLGIASNVVQPGQRDERKSVGSERWVRNSHGDDAHHGVLVLQNIQSNQ